jgi:hypothetical protein
LRARNSKEVPDGDVEVGKSIATAQISSGCCSFQVGRCVNRGKVRWMTGGGQPETTERNNAPNKTRKDLITADRRSAANWWAQSGPHDGGDRAGVHLSRQVRLDHRLLLPPLLPRPGTYLHHQRSLLTQQGCKCPASLMQALKHSSTPRERRYIVLHERYKEAIMMGID